MWIGQDHVFWEDTVYTELCWKQNNQDEEQTSGKGNIIFKLH